MDSIWPIVGTAICGVMLIGLLVAEARHSKRGKYLTKPAASLGFIIVAASAGSSDIYGQWILVGLVLGAGGDVALMFDGDKPFMAGLVSFLLGHVAYVVAISFVVPLGAWPTPYALLAILASAAVMRYLWPHLGSMKIPVIIYVIVITAMAVGAIAVVASGQRVMLDFAQALMLTAGAIAFFASDISVARDRFVSSGFFNRAWGLPAYYGGQLLLAWSTIG
jgi:uncharacterized membrane protein YhhN